MATATANRVQQDPPPVSGYTLNLSVREAEVLVNILNKIGGSPERSARGVARAILLALKEAGAKPSDDEVERSACGIYFRSK